MSDFAAARARTPAASRFVHLNHASTSLPDRSVFDAMRAFEECEASLGVHRALERMGDALEGARASCARLLGIGAHRIAFVESTTRAWALALSAIAPARTLDVVVGPLEWSTNLANVERMARARWRMVDDDGEGRYAASVERALARRDREAEPVVSLPTASCFGRDVHDLPQVGEVVRAAGGWLLVDAAQSVGRVPLDVDALGADALVFPTRKWLRGPRGVAILALSERALARFGLPSPLDLHGIARHEVDGLARLDAGADARRFEIHEHQPALRLGVAAAVDVARSCGLDAIATRTHALAMRLCAGLDAIDGVARTPGDDPAIVCFRAARHDAATIVARLWRDGVNAAAVGAAYAPLALRGEPDCVRLTPHAITRDDEIDTALAAIDRVLREPAR